MRCLGEKISVTLWSLPAGVIAALVFFGCDEKGHRDRRIGYETESVEPETTDDVDKPASISSARLTTWPNDARAAYSIIHDDFCATSGILDYAIPELKSRGLRIVPERGMY